MMTNAGKSENMGVELALNAQVSQALNCGISYGYTSAKFKEYNDGINDYSNNYIPYVPQNTFNAHAAYTFWNAGKLADKIQVRMGYNGIGKIYWDEANLNSQKFYSLLSASVYAEKGKFGLELWGKNLTDTDYNAFYFVSVGNAFFSQGRPAEYGVTLSIQL